jgi:hypothetical protein
MKISELLSKKSQTITSATNSNGHVDRKKSDQILDPEGYFAKNKKSIKKKYILAK